MASVIDERARVSRDAAATAGHAPAGDPEIWDERVPAFNPLFSRLPEASPVGVSPEFAQSDFDILDYLKEERSKDLLRFSTAGSVDDGKSTLIGRLLYDTQSVYEDQLRSIEGKGTTESGVLDLSLLTDGLRAEREQGITIDVAYRYFSTAHRKFIIADTPGHEQYTRNMATGASTADVAIVLVDARKGMLPQSRRHAYITALLGVRHVIVAINKMDLVGYLETTFLDIQRVFSEFFADLDVDGHEATQMHFVPVSALVGDNVVHGTDAMPWYGGPTLLGLLESIPSAEVSASAPFRLAVQRVVRPNLDFRGYAGQIATGTVRPGDRVLALPSGRSSRVERIVTFDGDLKEATAPLSVTLTLEGEIDISRGDLLVAQERPATVTSAFTASLVWMDATPLRVSRRYLLKHTSRTVQAQVRRVLHEVDLSELRQVDPGQDGLASLNMNGIGLVEIETLLPLAVDAYAANRHTGSFVLIDPQSYQTVAAGMIRKTEVAASGSDGSGRVSDAERVRRFGHAGASLRLRGSTEPGKLAEFAGLVERALFRLGANVVLAWPGKADVGVLVEAGLLVITVENSRPGDSVWVAEVSGFEARTEFDPSTGMRDAVEATLELLRQTVLRREEAF